MEKEADVRSLRRGGSKKMRASAAREMKIYCCAGRNADGLVQDARKCAIECIQDSDLGCASASATRPDQEHACEIGLDV